MTGWTYDPTAFTIDMSGASCIDPSNGLPISLTPPTAGEPIIWLNFDVRPLAGTFEIQINDNSGDNVGFALYYSAAPTNGTSVRASGEQLSGACSSLVFAACGGESSNTWNTLPVPNFASTTNYYLAVWDQDADGDLQINNFKARFGCGDSSVELCNLSVASTSTSCNPDGTYTLSIDIEGVNGEFYAYDANALNGGLSTSVCLTNSSDPSPVTSGTLTLDYPAGVSYAAVVFEQRASAPPVTTGDDPNCDSPTPYAGSANGNADDCVASLSGLAPACCTLDVVCPAVTDLGNADCASLQLIPSFPTTVADLLDDYGITVSSSPACGPASIEASDSALPDLCVGGGVMRTITVFIDTDASGGLTAGDLQEACLFTYDILPAPAPFFGPLPADVSIDCNDPLPNEIPEAREACNNTLIPVAASTSAGPASSATCAGDATLRTFTATDACGRSVTATQVITYTDNTPPVLAGVPANVELDCAAALPTSLPSATDDCDASPVVTVATSVGPAGCARDAVVRTFTATDACGNAATASQVVTFRDDTAPVLAGVPADIELDCAAALPTGLPTATDACGNAAMAAQVVTFRDDTAPVFAGIPADVELDCAAALPTGLRARRTTATRRPW